MIVELILSVALVISLIIVIKSANVFVDNLVEVGSVFGISETILGVTASAIGTVLGSNTFNILIGIGVPAIIKTIS